MHAARSVSDRIGSIETKIAEVASRQHGLITLAQLLALGATRRMIQTRCARGLLHRVYRGVYSVGHPPITKDARWMAAVLACGPRALLSHRSAAAFREIRNTARPRIDVISPTGAGRSHLGLDVHRMTVSDVDVEKIRGVPVTSLPRTIIDLATCVPEGALEYAIHTAERRRKLTPADLRQALARLPGVNGTAAVARIVGRPGHDLDARTRSRWELRFLEICRMHEIPMPRANEWIPLDIAAGGLEVDFSWPGQRLVVEVDEETGHNTMRGRKNDPLRDAALRGEGWRVVRIAEAEFAAPAFVADKVLRALYPRPSPWRRRSSP